MKRYKVQYGDYTGMCLVKDDLSEEDAEKLYREVNIEVDSYTLVEVLPYDKPFKFGS